MIVSKTTILVSAATALLVTMASPPKLRGSVHMAILLATHGVPYRAVSCVARLSALSQVSDSTCSESEPPMGKNACYLILTDENNTHANQAAWEGMGENDRGQALAWFSILQNTTNALVNVTQMALTTMGLSIGGLESVSEGEFMRAIGAAERSLNDEEFQQDECSPITTFLDQDNDGTLSVPERMAGMTGDCADQASEAMTKLCNFYVDLWSTYTAQGNITNTDWCNLLANDGDMSKDGSLSGLLHMFQDSDVVRVADA